MECSTCDELRRRLTDMEKEYWRMRSIVAENEIRDLKERVSKLEAASGGDDGS